MLSRTANIARTALLAQRNVPLSYSVFGRRMASRYQEDAAYYDASMDHDLESIKLKPPVNTILHFVPQQTNYVVERLGSFHRVAEPGPHIVIPIFEKIAYSHSLKEAALHVKPQAAVTKDNVKIILDGMLYVQIFDVYKASYNINDPLYAMSMLAQTTMRSEIGKLTLDETFEERQMLNDRIVASIDNSSSKWGVHCLRYEIKNITPPESIQHAMNMQAQAEREKRQEILTSEGHRQAAINEAEGTRQALILQSEGDREQRVNDAKGTAEAIRMEAEATAYAIERITAAINQPGGDKAVALRLGQQYLEKFGNLAKQNNSMIIPANVADVGGMIATAAKVYNEANSSWTGEAAKSSAQEKPAVAAKAKAVE